MPKYLPTITIDDVIDALAAFLLPFVPLAAFTATAAGDQLTVTDVTGVISIGDTLSGAGIPPGTTITAQVSDGVYTTSAATTATDAAVTCVGVIIRGQSNRVAPPVTAFVVLTEMLSIPLETPSVTNDSGNMQIAVSGPKQINVQIDFYGPSAGDQCAAVEGIYRSAYSTDQFPDGIKPLYTANGIQSPLITGEEQYESRWTLTASLQYNPVVALPQQSANALALATLEEI